MSEEAAGAQPTSRDVHRTAEMIMELLHVRHADELRTNRKAFRDALILRLRRLMPAPVGGPRSRELDLAQELYFPRWSSRV